MVAEAVYLMGESFSTPLPGAYIRPVTFMEGFNVHFQIKRLKESNSNGLDKLCWHYFQLNAMVRTLSIMPA